jgi:hypothetical protein
MPETVQKFPGDAKKSDDLLQNKNTQEKSPLWESPQLEDVSEQVMAQPYIRFT